MTDARTRAIREEQRHVDRAYARLDQLRERAEERRRDALAAPVVTHADLLNRDATAYQAAGRVQALSIGDGEALVFGRLDRDDGERHHIGRVSVLSEDYDPLVVDWRSDAAAPFYRATPSDPHGVHRRRIIQCRGPRVVDVEDQLLDDAAAEDVELVGDAALMAAISRDRSEHMRDIVATIQREQDEIIRLPAAGLVVVAGGPGTGKTAVALHRVAYLLYRHRERLEQRGVLVVAPSRAFTEYIQRVLPSLGETRVVLRPLGAFVPDAATDRHDPLDVAAVKGDARMVEVLRRHAERSPGARPRSAFTRLRRDPAALRGAADGVLDVDEVARLTSAWREDLDAGHGPSVEDVALIDELSAQLGAPPPRPSDVGRSADDEVTTFADRMAPADPGDLIATPGYTDFGHVVVDEAQDLSVMQWRMVARRGRAATWTVVGDVAQRAAPAVPDGWDDVARLVDVRDLTVRRLSINYRTTAPIMDLAARLLPVIAPDQTPPRSARRDGPPPRVLTAVEDPAGRSVEVARDLRGTVTGTVAVVATGQLLATVTDRLGDDRIAVLDPWRVKGLEFDAVVVAEPEDLVGAVGHGGLYVALTRATDRLAVVTSRPGLPPPLGPELT